MDFDYFYNREAERFNFLKVPEILVDGEEFKGLSAEAIILYSMLLKRTGMSFKNNWIDKDGRVFIYFTVEEIDMLLASVMDDTDSGIRDKAVLELMYAAGLQLTELLELKMSDVDIRAGLITAGLKKRRVIPIGSHARKAVEKYISDVRKLKFSKLSKKDASSPLFVNYLNKKFSRQGIWKIFKDYAAKTGIIKFTPNMLRNSFAVHMLQNGADIKTVQELMGHENISITKQYYIEIPSSTKLVYDKTHPRA